MSKDQAIVLLDKYLKGECSEEEKETVLLWLERLDNQSGQWSTLSEEEKRSYIKALYTDLSKKMTIETGRKKTNGQKWIYWAVAALLFIAATFGLLYTTIFQSNAPPTIKFMKVATGIGETEAITLADGTQVWLNSMSELRYSSGYNEAKREVYLTGEAFFNVSKNVDRPFVVHSGVLRTKVLGTSFDISAYPEDKNIEVTVLSGKVAVHNERQKKVVLEENEEVKYEKERAMLTKDKVTNTGDAVAWRQEQLAFYHTPMEEVAKAFYRTFGIKIRFSDKAVQQYEISGHFDIKQKSENILKAICLSIGGEYTKQGKTILIKDLKNTK